MAIQNGSDSFAALIQNDREDAANNKKHWSGNFLEYLEIVKENPSLAQLAHNRLYRKV